MAGEYDIVVNNPARPKGDPIEVPPFGQVENGGSFAAFLTKYEVERFKENPHVEVTSTKRKKSDLSDEDRDSLAAAQALEDSYAAELEAAEAAVANTPVAGDESIAATEPEEGGN